MKREYIVQIDFDGDLLENEELVRCKYCKYGYHMVNLNYVHGTSNVTYRVYCTKPYIEKGNAIHDPDWFCADGKREDYV